MAGLTKVPLHCLGILGDIFILEPQEGKAPALLPAIFFCIDRLNKLFMKAEPKCFEHYFNRSCAFFGKV
ncbi:MAG: hypothetical protein WCI43_07705 [Candidatus Firestonebacteria bacterium]